MVFTPEQKTNLYPQPQLSQRTCPRWFTDLGDCLENYPTPEIDSNEMVLQVLQVCWKPQMNRTHVGSTSRVLNSARSFLTVVFVKGTLIEPFSVFVCGEEPLRFPLEKAIGTFETSMKRVGVKVMTKCYPLTRMPN
ncbi:hypothetical protein A6R68_03702, partial [Neotoma lepida]